MRKLNKIVLAFLISCTLIAIVWFMFNSRGERVISESSTPIMSTPNLVQQVEETWYEGVFTEKPVHILLLGLDIGSERRSRGQRGSNADTIMVLSILPETKKALFTSIPRDLWVGNSKINAVLSTKGVDEMMRQVSLIIGQEVNAYAMIDFDGFRWLIDYFGGIDVEVENAFTDTQFPNNNDSGPITISFSQGIQRMNGEQALNFARSRKGNNGEGSDLKRAKRQHQILKGVLGAVSNPANLQKFDPQKFYENAVLNLKSNISLNDALYLYSYYKDHLDYQTNSLVLDDRYIFHPADSSPYGGAWVFVSREANYQTLHNDIQSLLKPSSNSPDTQN